MEFLGTIARLLVLLVTIGSIACSGGPTAPSPASYAGSWSGTTAQGKAVSFTATSAGVTNLSVGYTVQGRFSNAIGSGTCTANGTVELTLTNAPATITGASFKVSSGTVSDMSGTFTSSTSASGSLTVNLTTTSSCAGTATTTWTANRS